ncbi:MAG: rhodanese-like domain-containing protein [Dissulfurispiraceae bacterium]|nr:rhodanese-like domain-containing protein [Dissulfurispiraceae bacterium]
MEVPRISIDDLKNLIESKTPVTIVDLRLSNAYAGSKLQIQGAIHIDPEKDEALEAFANSRAKDERIVFY